MSLANARAKASEIVFATERGRYVDPKSRFLEDEMQLKCVLDEAHKLKQTVVLTQGTFDMVHIGHARYLREAKKHGDLLIVGLDDDKKARARKGENRPVVPFEERREILTHLRYVDAVVMKKADDPRWHLIKIVRPEILIAVEGTYIEEQVAELSKFCGKVVVLPRQAETSTSAKIRKLVLDGAETFAQFLAGRASEFVMESYNLFKKGEK